RGRASPPRGGGRRGWAARRSRRWWGVRGGLGPPRPLLEHREHPVGHDETADHVRRAEDDGEEPEHDAQRAGDRARDEHRADDDDTVDRVRAGHERGVQGRGHLRDDLEPDEDREDEDVGGDDCLRGHADLAGAGGRSPPTSRAFFVASWTTSPVFVMTVPFTTSSFMSTFSVPSLASMRPSRLATFREYIWLA